MISAPNRLPRSNGNSTLWLFVLISSLLFASCELFKKGDDQLPDPLSGDLPGLTPLSGKGPHIAMLLPFMSDRYSASSPNFYETSKWAIHFYCGVKLAIEDLEKEGISFQLDLFDSKASEDEVSRLLSTDSRFQQADLIIGPYRSNNLKLVAEFGKRYEVPIVSPYSAASGISSENPYFIQVNPSLKAHCTAITNHVRERYSADQVVLVVRNQPDELSRLQYFQDANRAFFTYADTARLQEYIVSDNSADYNTIDVTPYLQSDKKMVFIIPSWANESFVYSLLRKIKLAKTNLSEVVVYGMPRWMEFEQIMDYDLYEDLDVHVSSSFYSDDFDESVKAFNRRYFGAFGELPLEEAFVGYEVVRYFVHQIKEEGDKFLERLDSKDATNLYTTYQFRKIVDMPMVSDDFRRRFGRYENEYVHILEFKDYYFQPATD
ncbi:MAG: amino acid ABC transporter substrate-binding protein [Saprospirales bacterium]|nr:amino acid ABC transporter substrate-binding protein [Saprospirales bacterium]